MFRGYKGRRPGTNVRLDFQRTWRNLCDSFVRLMFNTGNVTADTLPSLWYSVGINVGEDRGRVFRRQIYRRTVRRFLFLLDRKFYEISTSVRLIDLFFLYGIREILTYLTVKISYQQKLICIFIRISICTYFFILLSIYVFIVEEITIYSPSQCSNMVNIINIIVFKKQITQIAKLTDIDNPYSNICILYRFKSSIYHLSVEHHFLTLHFILAFQ